MFVNSKLALQDKTLTNTFTKRFSSSSLSGIGGFALLLVEGCRTWWPFPDTPAPSNIVWSLDVIKPIIKQHSKRNTNHISLRHCYLILYFITESTSAIQISQLHGHNIPENELVGDWLITMQGRISNMKLVSKNDEKLATI